jgi:hypothetical protein
VFFSPCSSKYDNLVQQLISNVILFQLTYKSLDQFCLESLCALSCGNIFALSVICMFQNITWRHLYYIVLSAVSMLKRPALTDYQSAESEQLMKRLRPGGHGIDEVITVILHLHLEKYVIFGFCMNFNNQSCLCRPHILLPPLNLHGQWMIFQGQLLVHCHMDLM